MIQENELVMLIIGIGVLIFMLNNLDKIRQLPYSKVFLASFLAFFCGWIATVVEGFILYDLFNLIEHFAYLASSLLAVLWCWKLLQDKKKDTNELHSDP